LWTQPLFNKPSRRPKRHAYLEGARAKIERAKEHIRDLDREKTAFLALNPYAVTPEFHVEHGSTAYFLDKLQPIPVCIPLLAGDAAHCLRAALDYLAYSLVPELARKPNVRIYFPICKSLKKYAPESVKKTDGMPKEAKKLIDTFKPYGGGDDRLWELHLLDIIDKHRLLVTTATTVATLGFEIDSAFVESSFKGMVKLPPGAIPKQTFNFPAPEPLFPMEKGALLYSVKGNFETDHRINFIFDIAFGEPEVFKGQLLVKTLSELANMVESIVLSFNGVDFI
jgi:hypothetical protein